MKKAGMALVGILALTSGCATPKSAGWIYGYDIEAKREYKTATYNGKYYLIKLVKELYDKKFFKDISYDDSLRKMLKETDSNGDKLITDDEVSGIKKKFEMEK